MVYVNKILKAWGNQGLREGLQNIFMNILVHSFNFGFSGHEVCFCSTVLDFNDEEIYFSTC